jgi:hypothetical protein
LTQVSEGLFNSCTGLADVTLPAGLTQIGAKAFFGCAALSNVFYKGTGEQWQQIYIASNNQPLRAAHIHFESTGHTPGETVIENEFISCFEDGYHDEVVYCVFCDYEFSRVRLVLPAAGHEFITHPEVPATCVSEGVTAYTECVRCGIWGIEPQVIPAAGHAYGPAMTVEPTCTENGMLEQICTVCGDINTQIILARGHAPGEPTRENEVAATRTENGSYDLVTRCTRCNAALETESYSEPALGHTYESTVTTAPTCTEPGVRTYTCIRCPETYTEAEPATGHGSLGYDESGAPSTCSVRGYSMTICIACGEITDYQEFPLDPTNHNWSRWAVVTPATYLTEGLEQRACGWCGDTETRPIPALVPDEVISDPDTGIELQLQQGVLPENTVFTVDEEFDGTYFRLLNREVGNLSSTLYNITPVADGVNVQPDGWVLVRLPIPAGYNPDSLSIYYISTETGVTERMDCYVEDGYICFQTTHFSVYAIVDASAPAEAPTETPTNNGGGTSLSFFARISAFFQRIADFFKNLFRR